MAVAATRALPGLPRRLWAAVLTGVPLATFKLAGGLIAARDLHPWLGTLFVIWAGFDVLFNLGSLLWPERLAYCLLANLGRQLDRRRGHRGAEEALLALDTFLAGMIVATMIFFHRIRELPAPIGEAWDLAVITSVLAAGIERVWGAFRQLGRPALT